MISNIELVGDQGRTSVTCNADNTANVIEADKTFTSINPITLRFTVDYTTGGGNQFSVLEHITNNTGVNWSDYHIAMTNGPDGVVFNQFNLSGADGRVAVREWAIGVGGASQEGEARKLIPPDRLGARPSFDRAL